MATVPLSNTAIVNATYDGQTTQLVSAPEEIQLLNAVTITKVADKQLWAGGELLYTVTIVNSEDMPFTAVTFEDTLNPTLITLVDDSVTVGGSTAAYSFEPTSGVLTVALEDIDPTDTVIITFRVEKK